MDPDFSNYYQKQLRYITASYNGEFAQQHPQIAARLERYVAAYVSEHSFTRTVLCSKQRGVIFTWPTRSGTREVF